LLFHFEFTTLLDALVHRDNAMATNFLTEEDVTKLLTERSGESRAEAAAKIAVGFGQASLSERERHLAEEIFRVMVKDAEVRVREALSQNLKENPLVPHDVALTLARDVDSVALPVLQFSLVLTDSDLIDIIRSQNVAKQMAIAGRSKVSEDVSEALVETENQQVVTRLVSNEGAQITEKSLQKVVDDFGEIESVQDAVVHRVGLPVTVSERLVTMVSENLRAELVKRHELPKDLATDLLMQTRERATLSLASEGDQEDLDRLIFQMREYGRLTPSIILRALCMGDLRFFEAALSDLAQVPVVNTHKLIHDSGQLGLRGIFQKAGLPAAFFPAVRAAIQVAHETTFDGLDKDRERYSRRMIERILTHYDDLGVKFESDDLEYLLTKMNQLPAGRMETTLEDVET
jgi:uncharacterized protein (DUF2336 family)